MTTATKQVQEPGRGSQKDPGALLSIVEQLQGVQELLSLAASTKKNIEAAFNDPRNKDEIKTDESGRFIEVVKGNVTTTLRMDKDGSVSMKRITTSEVENVLDPLETPTKLEEGFIVTIKSSGQPTGHTIAPRQKGAQPDVILESLWDTYRAVKQAHSESKLLNIR